MNSRESYDKLTSNGVNYIGTDTLEPFLINNDKDFPMSVECFPIFLDDLSECKMSDEHTLRDNEFYNIHYSSNIYKKSMDINETAIGEFRIMLLIFIFLILFVKELDKIILIVK